MEELMDTIVSLSKRRGFVFPGSQIYGGLANTYDYGPLGTELLRNIKNAWWDYFVTQRNDILGLNSAVIMNPAVWEASGHIKSFAEVLIDCKKCQYRTRADYLIENFLEERGEEKRVEGLPPKEMDRMIRENKIKCPNCGKFDWTKGRLFNNLFETHIGIISGEKNLAYLRGEVAQGMFVNFKNILDSMSPELPFGLAQSGTAFRNEITLGNFIFRTLQFNLSEFEYFFNPAKQDWKELFSFWKNEIYLWATGILGLKQENLCWRPHTDEERAHYSLATEDLDYKYPFGFKEMHAVAYRTDFDLKNHMEKSGVDLRYSDRATGEKFIPHVIEPTFGMDRAFLALLCDAYREDGDRVYLSLAPHLAPYKAAVFPLLANKPKLVEKARQVYEMLKKELKENIAWDDRGNIGKRYYSQDEIATPYCVTIDFDTLEDDTVTIRDRDTTGQRRVLISQLTEEINKVLSK
jgi:glycyl-tRNA synthetase